MFSDITQNSCLSRFLIVSIKCLYSMILVLTVLLIQQINAQSGTNYQIKKSVIDQGGAPSQSDNYKVADAIGQPSPVGEATSTNYVIFSGFLGGGVSIPTALGEIYNSNIPIEFQLHQNYPNPFNPSTKIKFDLPKPETVKIEVYNIIGQKIGTLLNKSMPAGYHEVEFNGQNMSSGIYLYWIEAGEWNDVKKMLLFK